MKVTNKEKMVLKMAKRIQKYCEYANCDECPFCLAMWDIVDCAFTESPRFWKLSEIEDKINGKHHR